MKHAWLVAMALALFVGSPAEARKECRPVETADAAEETEAEDRWPHDTQYGWPHQGGGSGWVHGRDDDDAAADDDAEVEDGTDGSWVHDTDYGWWAAVPGAALAEVEDDPVGSGDEDALEDCTVSRERNECVVLANQIARYRFQLALAIDREDLLWEDSLRAHIERLETRGEFHDCPWVEPSLREKIVVTLNEVIKAVGVASQVAATLYRMGVF
ncbi:MAG: hypothetical protein HKP30_08230 [Myxococcales bacterium]|nr:hypothetical protein [Myxococcales bacterium]